jgi:guanylate kinase
MARVHSKEIRLNSPAGHQRTKKSMLIVISGPSGCGKTTIARAILGRHPEMTFSVSATTRPKRAVEIQGQDYFFIPKEDFEAKVSRCELVEWEKIYGDHYGTLKSEVERALNSDASMVFDVDVKGALSIKQKYPERTVLIFIEPPSLEVLTERLRNRQTESEETFARRIERVTMELKLGKEFDHRVQNNSLDRAIAEVDAIVAQAVGMAT